MKPPELPASDAWKGEFRRFLDAAPGRLHFAAHSHHLWPDVSFAAQQQAWLDAARLADQKWAQILGHVLPQAQAHVARILHLRHPAHIAFAPNSHELLSRLVSSIERRPVRILTTSSEFHSFERQRRRWQEAGTAQVVSIATEPFESFEARFLEAAARPGHDLIFLSQVFFDSGLVFESFAALAAAVPADETLVAIDGYHGFMARPTDFSALEARAFYLAGGYKYAMAGEGACFMHCPPGYGPRPVDTGWLAAFEDLEAERAAPRVAYPDDGMRFFGSTFDPSGLYRLNAALGRWQTLGVGVADIHRHVGALQQQFLAAIERAQAGPLASHQLLPPATLAERGHFLTFRRSDASQLHRALRARGVITDVRNDRLRFGFGLYQDRDDVDALLRHLRALA